MPYTFDTSPLCQSSLSVLSVWQSVCLSDTLAGSKSQTAPSSPCPAPPYPAPPTRARDRERAFLTFPIFCGGGDQHYLQLPSGRGFSFHFSRLSPRSPVFSYRDTVTSGPNSVSRRTFWSFARCLNAARNFVCGTRVPFKSDMSLAMYKDKKKPKNNLNDERRVSGCGGLFNSRLI